MTTSTIFTVQAGACPTYNPDEPTYSPFQNLEEKRIKSACLRDRAFQDQIARVHYCARVIIHHYWAGKFTLEEAVSLLGMYCHRNKDAALMNIQNSQYARHTPEELRRVF